ncbi:MAG TPA: hypothetical protein VMU39_25840 [Solirubrobacteraceae bacterium]|nr:hypothetical protein [Solirubrobacteraceae bacterium]
MKTLAHTFAAGLMFLAALPYAGAQVKPILTPPKTTVITPPTTTTTTTTPLQVPVQVITPPPAYNFSIPLKGFVDLHAHPMAHLGFGGKLIYGSTDADPNGNGSIITAITLGTNNCGHSVWGGTGWSQAVRATSEAQALGPENPIHGGPDANPFTNNNPCGNFGRESIIHQLQTNTPPSIDPPDSTYTTSGLNPGGASFANWPAWNDLTRQKMWVEWIRRAYNGGLRVMVALAVNNKLLGDAVTAGNVSGPPDLPTDDKTSADIQILEMKRMVANSNFMAIAYSSTDVYNIVSQNKLAVVLGIEIDHPGNLTGSAPTAAVTAEIDRLYGEGVRYIFPVHLTDNAIGGTAGYNDLFIIANVYTEGGPNAFGCVSPAATGINYVPFKAAQPFVQTIASALHVPVPGPLGCQGAVNTLGLRPNNGIAALHQMMKHGMLIDIDHMSEAGYRGSLQYAATYGYPLNSGHNGLRIAADPNSSERSFPVDVYAQIGALHGMAGVGSAKMTSYGWLQSYNAVMSAMSNNGKYNVVGAFGTDLNGLEFGMPPRGEFERDADANATPRNQCESACSNPATSDCLPNSNGHGLNPTCVRQCTSACSTTYPVKMVCTGWCGVPPPNVYSASFPMLVEGTRQFNYNVEGVSQYGLLADFVQDVRALPSINGARTGADTIDNNFMYGADYFFRTWQLAEQKGAAMP